MADTTTQEAPVNEQNSTPDTVPQAKAPEAAPRTFTQEEVDAMVQQRISEERERFKLDADKKAAIALAEREQVLLAKEAAVRKKQLEISTAKLLEGRGINSALAAFLDYTDEATLQDGLSALEHEWKIAVQRGVNARFGNALFVPRVKPGGADPAHQTDDPFAKGLTGLPAQLAENS